MRTVIRHLQDADKKVVFFSFVVIVVVIVGNLVAVLVFFCRLLMILSIDYSRRTRQTTGHVVFQRKNGSVSAAFVLDQKKAKNKISFCSLSFCESVVDLSNVDRRFMFDNDIPSPLNKINRSKNEVFLIDIDALFIFSLNLLT